MSPGAYGHSGISCHLLPLQLASKWTATELPVQQDYTAALQKCVLRAEGGEKQLAKGRGAAQPSWDFEAT